jgi:hypothetical protein
MQNAGPDSPLISTTRRDGRGPNDGWIGKRPDLSDRALIALIVAAAAALVVYFAFVQAVLPEAWRRPGSPELYLMGAAGTALLLVSMAFVWVKRTGRGGFPPAWFIAHVVASTVGGVLIGVHSAGYLRRPPALLFLALLGLVALGVWARVRLSRQMAATFATKQRSFTPATPATRGDLRDVIARKRALLPSIDGNTNEGTFSLTLAHWLRTPRAAFRYARLVGEENRLMGTRASVGSEQAYWRPLHLALAYLFIFGIFVHVMTVTFFAGYVADGGPITWWHLADW